jgi:hypothetical protein
MTGTEPCIASAIPNHASRGAERSAVPAKSFFFEGRGGSAALGAAIHEHVRLGPSAATCGSTRVGAPAMRKNSIAGMRRNCSLLPRTFSWRMAARSLLPTPSSVLIRRLRTVTRWMSLAPVSDGDSINLFVIGSLDEMHYALPTYQVAGCE